MGAGLARRHYQRYLGTVTRPHPQQFQRTHLNSPQSPGSSWASCLCTTRLAAGIFHTPNLAGRWSLLQVEPLNEYRKDAGAGGNMLNRYGIISRQAVIAENIPGGFPSMQTLCRSMGDSGRIMRGRFVEGLGGAQFAERLTIDRLRDLATQATQTRHYTPVALSPTNPANVWGIFCPGLHIRQRWYRRVGRVRWWSFLAANCYSIWRKAAKNAGLAGKGGIASARFPGADHRTASRTKAALYANRSE
ncbi:Lhr family helicase [Shigella flexneri]